MVKARRKPGTPARRGKKGRGWLLLLLGLGIGVAAVLLVQLLMPRDPARGGLARLFSSAGKAPVEAQEPTARKDPEPAKPGKTRFDFYTILPETETVLPERTARTRPEKAAKTAPEEGVSYVLQAGSFPTFQDADQLKAKLALNGVVAQIQKVTIEGKGDYYRVRLGPYDGLEKLDAAEQQLKHLGIAKPLAIKIKKGAG